MWAGPPDGHTCSLCVGHSCLPPARYPAAAGSKSNFLRFSICVRSGGVSSGHTSTRARPWAPGGASSRASWWVPPPWPCSCGRCGWAGTRRCCGPPSRSSSVSSRRRRCGRRKGPLSLTWSTLTTQVRPCCLVPTSPRAPSRELPVKVSLTVQ